MRLKWLFTSGLLALLLPMAAMAASLGLLAPVVEQGAPLTRPDASGRPVPVVTRVDAGPLHDALQREASEGFTATMLALDAQAQQLAGASSPAPTWLYLSAEDGGFARRGFWLREDGGERYLDEPFVDLVVDADSVADGSFEEIFAHELGHVFLRRLLPGLPKGHSTTPHHAYTLTDYPTAFDEGFAIHFQLLARRLTRNAALAAQDQGFDTRPYLPHWQSNRDRTLRIDGVRRNLFVHAQRPFEGGGDALARETLSPEFAAARLRNGQQMLSSEGVVATLFHRWIGPVTEAGVVAAYTPWFEVFMALQRRELRPDSPLPTLLLRVLHSRDPQAGGRAIGLFVDTTYGATMDPSMALRAGALAEAGASGNVEAFVGQLGPAREALSALRTRARQEPASLDAALGPGLWLLSEGEPALAVNLNTAGAAELQALGLPAPAAARLLGSREARGAFHDIPDVVARGQLDTVAAVALHARAAAQAAAGARARPRAPCLRPAPAGAPTAPAGRPRGGWRR
ncbi:MAG: hypothetical protein K0M64_09075, partial [Rhizobium sp.]|nr:hypothetical protein [Rhizobium sp.]